MKKVRSDVRVVSTAVREGELVDALGVSEEDHLDAGLELQPRLYGHLLILIQLLENYKI